MGFPPWHDSMRVSSSRVHDFTSGTWLASAERRREGLLPASVVDGPVNFRFVSRAKGSRPNSLVSFIPRDIQAIDNGHAASQIAGSFDVHKMLALRCNDA